MGKRAPTLNMEVTGSGLDRIVSHHHCYTLDNVQILPPTTTTTTTTLQIHTIDMLQLATDEFSVRGLTLLQLYYCYHYYC